MDWLRNWGIVQLDALGTKLHCAAEQLKLQLTPIPVIPQKKPTAAVVKVLKKLKHDIQMSGLNMIVDVGDFQVLLDYPHRSVSVQGSPVDLMVSYGENKPMIGFTTERSSIRTEQVEAQFHFSYFNVIGFDGHSGDLTIECDGIHMIVNREAHYVKVSGAEIRGIERGTRGPIALGPSMPIPKRFKHILEPHVSERPAASSTQPAVH
jgi:hypothetical protein